MIKTIILHHLLDMNDLPAAERWFYRYHIPEVLRNQPVSYVSYRAVPPPPGAEDFGYFNYKVHENLNRGEGEKPLGLLAMTKEVVPLKVIMVNVPATPTEDFLGKGTSFEEKTILRWLVASLPRGRERRTEGTTGISTCTPRKSCGSRGSPASSATRSSPRRWSWTRWCRPSCTRESVVSSDWHRVSEQWYENGNGWVDSVLTSPPEYTRPPWATYDRYPFLEPGVDFASTFILERPTDDWLREVPPFLSAASGAGRRLGLHSGDGLDAAIFDCVDEPLIVALVLVGVSGGESGHGRVEGVTLPEIRPDGDPIARAGVGPGERPGAHSAVQQHLGGSHRREIR